MIKETSFVKVGDKYMGKSLSNIEIKRQNKRNILRYLLIQEKVTKPEIAEELQLSIPTVSQIVNELFEAGMVFEEGRQQSKGGRRAAEHCLNAGYCYAAGIDITKRHVELAVVDLKGEIIATKRIRENFEISDTYYKKIQKAYKNFLQEHGIEMRKVTGLGVALPGIISMDQKSLQQSHILELNEPMFFRGLEELPYPVHFFNDASAACIAEQYANRVPEDYIFLSLSDSVGGAIVQNKHMVSGYHGRTGEFGHACIVPGGKKCYCGKRGHYDPYGSALCLSGLTDGSLKDFFRQVEAGNPQMETALEEYLDYLALMVYNLRVSTDLPVVIGGYVGSYLSPYLERLKAKVEEYSIFENTSDYIYTSSCKEAASAVGSARYFIEEFVEAIT